MVLMEESREKPLLCDRDPDGLDKIVENSHILEASHVKEVRDATFLTCGLWVGRHEWILSFQAWRREVFPAVDVNTRYDFVFFNLLAA